MAKSVANIYFARFFRSNAGLLLIIDTDAFGMEFALQDVTILWERFNSMNTNRFNYGSADPSNWANSMQGTILVSTERLNGSAFEKSVVLLMQDDVRGTFGVALNKPAGANVRTAWEKLTGSEATGEQSIVAGGPLQGPVFALHQMPDLSDVEMPGGLYVSAQVDKLQQLMMQFEEPYRIVIGVAGWKPGQLDKEVDSGCWYKLPMDLETVFDDPEWMWDSCLQDYGLQQVVDMVGIDLIPDDPDLN